MPAYLEPTEESGRAFFLRGMPGGVVMLNLLRFRAAADYSATPELAPNPPFQGKMPIAFTCCTPFRIWSAPEGSCCSMGVEANS